MITHTKIVSFTLSHFFCQSPQPQTERSRGGINIDQLWSLHSGNRGNTWDFTDGMFTPNIDYYQQHTFTLCTTHCFSTLSLSFSFSLHSETLSPLSYPLFLHPLLQPSQSEFFNAFGQQNLEFFQIHLLQIILSAHQSGCLSVIKCIVLMTVSFCLPLSIYPINPHTF